MSDVIAVTTQQPTAGAYHLNQGAMSDVIVVTTQPSACESRHLDQRGAVNASMQFSTGGLQHSNQHEATYVVSAITPKCSPSEPCCLNQHGNTPNAHANTTSLFTAQLHQSAPLPVMSNVPAISSSLPSKVYTSTPVQPRLVTNESTEPYCQNAVGPFTQLNATASMMEKVTLGMDSILTRSNLPPLNVVKFVGEPHAYYRFKARFHEMVESQRNISELQKMSRLLQFLDGEAKRAVAGYEGVPGGLQIALKVLEQRFGQPHMVAKSCVDALVDGPNISSDDTRSLQEFADKSRSLFETLKSMNALSEMNMTNLAKMSGKLPIPLQAKWRDKAQRIRAGGESPSVKELVQFIERQAEAANDPVFGKIGESHKSLQKPHSQPSPRKGPSDHITTSGGSKVTTLSTQVESSHQGQRDIPSSMNNVTSESSIKCYICGLPHTIEKCPEFAGNLFDKGVS